MNHFDLIHVDIEFIGCKIENTKLTVQYGQCMDALNAARALQTTVDPDEPADLPSVLATARSDSDPGGMITDPDPGGMLTDPDPAGRVFAPTSEDLDDCLDNNTAFRESVVLCANKLLNCTNNGNCW